jgi:hypothetical protein
MNQSLVATSSSLISVADPLGAQETISPEKSSPLRTRSVRYPHAGPVTAWCRRPAISSREIAFRPAHVTTMESGFESACISCAAYLRRSFARASGERFHGMGRANLH